MALRLRPEDPPTRRPAMARGTVPHPSYPWWLEEAESAGLHGPACNPLFGSRTVDVAVVGGGYTGLWTALTLRERAPELSVAVVEAQSCGSGPSGRNGGVLHGYWEMFPKLVELFGHDHALEVAFAGSEAQRAVVDFCSNSGEDVWLNEAGIAVGATSVTQESAVDAALRYAADLPERFRPRELTSLELATMSGSDSFRRAALYPEAATLQPARLAFAMKRAALEAGVDIYESSPVIDVEPGGAVVRTATGELRCSDVVMAGNAWMSAQRPYSRHLTNLGSFVVVTEPIPDVVNGMGMRSGVAIKDGRMFLHWARATPDGRLVVGTGAGPMSYRGKVTGVHTAHVRSATRAAAALRTFFPTAADARIERSWGGPIDMSADRLPFFGTLPDSRVHYGLGYSGHGVNATWIGGQVLASLVLRQRDRWTSSPFCHRQVPRLPPEPFRFVGGRMIHASVLAVEDAHDEGKRAPTPLRAAAALPRLLGLRIGTR